MSGSIRLQRGWHARMLPQSGCRLQAHSGAAPAAPANSKPYPFNRLGSARGSRAVAAGPAATFLGAFFDHLKVSAGALC
jgi:hypothetical protein